MYSSSLVKDQHIYKMKFNNKEIHAIFFLMINLEDK